ncbi:MAG: WbqC family protein [Bacteroidaceae bacterium]|nr:WbqC family protein [Bacteroidaceae bacterium]
MKILSHPLYLAPVPLYARLFAADGIVFDGDSPFTKQTFRNRTVIATENGTQALTIPIVHTGGKQPMRDIRISEHGNWRHLHWNAIVSAYRKSPFFDYYADDFAHFYEERDGFLMDFNMRLHAVVCELLGLERTTAITMEKAKNDIENLRHMAEPTTLAQTEGYTSQPYYQVFATRNGFQPNLSIADLLFNMGPEALITLRDSCK